jgi:RNA polymerase sigma-70 factor (ECF subfamily)
MLETESASAASDADLALLLAGGDPAAEPELYRRLAPRVRLYGLRHLRDAAAADDLVQDALLMAFEMLRTGRVREPERFVSFVLGCCRRIVADLHRGAERRRGLLERFGAGLAPVSNPESPAMDLERLVGCLERLAERERSVVMMSFYAETPSEQIGTELGLSTGNVRVVRHRALARLRSCMEGV